MRTGPYDNGCAPCKDGEHATAEQDQTGRFRCTCCGRTVREDS